MFDFEVIWACETEFLKKYIETIASVTMADAHTARIDFGDLSNAVDVEVSGSEARVEISGVLTPDGPSFIDKFFGIDGTSYKSLISALKDLESNDSVENVYLDMDTPGGSVKMMDDARNAILSLRESGKNVIAMNHGLLASAGYYLATAANTIVAANPLVFTGSIGVKATFIDRSKRESELGIKRVVIVSENAPNKDVDISTISGVESVKDELNAIERNFFKKISEGRNIPVDSIKSDFGRGGVLIASDPGENKTDALSVNMIDAVIETKPVVNIDRNTGFETSYEQEQTIMTLKELLAENPSLQAEIDQVVADAIAAKTGEVSQALAIAKSDKYPSKIKELSYDVIAGNKPQATLEGAVVAYDAFMETRDIELASEETEVIGSTDSEEAPVEDNKSADSRTYEELMEI